MHIDQVSKLVRMVSIEAGRSQVMAIDGKGCGDEIARRGGRSCWQSGPMVEDDDDLVVLEVSGEDTWP